MIKLREMDHFGIEVTDLARARNFYCDVLGMRFLQDLGRDGMLLRCGDHNVALHLNPELPPAPPDRIANPLGKAHHAFKVSPEDFAAACAGLAALKVPMHDPVNWGDHDCLYFLDPDGNLLELINHR
ncbi:MAG: VOC family protein [Deltaproteobacteria bacterium]|nr:VOC family protein [Deltaproteobacteria bacterium]